MKPKNMSKKEVKKPNWVKSFSLEFPDYGHGHIRVYSDWICYGEIGFNPATSYKHVLKEAEDKVKALKVAYKKWQEEFNEK